MLIWLVSRGLHGNAPICPTVFINYFFFRQNKSAIELAEQATGQRRPEAMQSFVPRVDSLMDMIDQDQRSSDAAKQDVMTSPKVSAELNTKTLMPSSNTVAIRHGTEVYTLRITRANKLILTK